MECSYTCSAAPSDDEVVAQGGRRHAQRDAAAGVEVQVELEAAAQDEQHEEQVGGGSSIDGGGQRQRRGVGDGQGRGVSCEQRKLWVTNLVEVFVRGDTRWDSGGRYKRLREAFGDG